MCLPLFDFTNRVLKIMKIDSDFNLSSSDNNCNIPNLRRLGINIWKFGHCAVQLKRWLKKTYVLIHTCLQFDVEIFAWLAGKLIFVYVIWKKDTFMYPIHYFFNIGHTLTLNSNILRCNKFFPLQVKIVKPETIKRCKI